MKKSILHIILVITVAMSLIACGKDNTTNKKDTTTVDTKVEETVKQDAKVKTEEVKKYKDESRLKDYKFVSMEDSLARPFTLQVYDADNKNLKYASVLLTKELIDVLDYAVCAGGPEIETKLIFKYKKDYIATCEISPAVTAGEVYDLGINEGERRIVDTKKERVEVENEDGDVVTVIQTKALGALQVRTEVKINKADYNEKDAISFLKKITDCISSENDSPYLSDIALKESRMGFQVRSYLDVVNVSKDLIYVKTLKSQDYADDYTECSMILNDKEKKVLADHYNVKGTEVLAAVDGYKVTKYTLSGMFNNFGIYLKFEKGDKVYYFLTSDDQFKLSGVDFVKEALETVAK